MEQWDHAMAQKQRCSVGTIQGLPLLASLGRFSASGRFRCAGGFFLPRHYHNSHPDCSPCAYSPGTWPRKWGRRRTWSRQDNTQMQNHSRPMPFLDSNQISATNTTTDTLIQTPCNFSVFTQPQQCTTEAMLYSSKPTEKVSSHS